MSWLVLLWCVQDPLIEKLHSPYIEERAEAQAELEEVDLDQLPRIRKALEGEEDREVRARLQAVICSLEDPALLWKAGRFKDARTVFARHPNFSERMTLSILDIFDGQQPRWSASFVFAYLISEALRTGGANGRMVQIAVRMGADIVPYVVPCLRVNNDSFRVELCRFLGELGDTQAVPALKRMARHKGKPVRKAAAAALEALR